MDGRLHRHGAPPPRSGGGAVRRSRTPHALPILCILVVAPAFTSCGEAEVAEPVAPVVASIEMLPGERPLSFVGMSVRMGARGVAADGSLLGGSRTYPERFSWESDAPDVVTVDEFGVIHALAEGTARITATSEGVSGTATVTVREVIRAAWSVPIERFDGGLAIGGDGTIYVAARDTLHALTPEGASLWAAYTGARVNASPAVAGDGTIYLGTSGSGASLMAMAPSGTRIWTRDDLGWVTTAPALGADGTVYVSADGGTLHALHPDGQTKWEFDAEARFTSSPAVAQDGTIFVGDDDGRLHAVNADGTTRWTFLADGPVQSSPALAPDGTIYFGSQDQHLYALGADGRLTWRLPLPLRNAAPAPVLGSDGMIYIGGDGLHAVTANGQLRWTYPGIAPGAGTVHFATPVIGGDGTIYAGGGRHLYAVNPDGTLRWDYPSEGNFLREPAIGVDGTVLAGSGAGIPEGRALHAVVELDRPNVGFESAPWPKARGNRANTGRSGGR